PRDPRALFREDRPFADPVSARRAATAVVAARGVHAQRGSRHRGAATASRPHARSRRKRNRRGPCAIARAALRDPAPRPGRLPDAVLRPLRSRRRAGPLASRAAGCPHPTLPRKRGRESLAFLLAGGRLHTSGAAVLGLEA